MFECDDVTSLLEGSDDDPRINDRYIRCLSAGQCQRSVLLVGVVHDHPSSVFRVSFLLERLSPETLALELPPLAVPLFRRYADDDHVPPRLGGEMSMAIQTAGAIPTVGIDAPNRGYLKILFLKLLSADPSIGIVKRLLEDTITGWTQAIACRGAGVLSTLTPLRPRVYEHLVYGCTVLDSPTVQAEHEAAHVLQRQAFLDAIEVPRSIALIDAAREQYMALRLDELRAEGDVVAIVGVEHLDGVMALLHDLS